MDADPEFNGRWKRPSWLVSSRDSTAIIYIMLNMNLPKAEYPGFAVAHLGSESHALAMARRHFSDAVPFAALDSPRPWSLWEERHAVRMFENPCRAYRGMKPRCSYFSPGDICK
jgi:hypothetical protein